MILLSIATHHPVTPASIADVPDRMTETASYYGYILTYSDCFVEYYISVRFSSTPASNAWNEVTHLVMEKE